MVPVDRVAHAFHTCSPPDIMQQAQDVRCLGIHVRVASSEGSGSRGDLAGMIDPWPGVMLRGLLQNGFSLGKRWNVQRDYPARS